uniref:Tyrosinase copper-binding domain-containing protein n=1 Tax=Globisporangium ultimum (strain ATCC 200006 / CBS 805.95 / DAOM BR144) TaxID=431595 RepID=K3WTH9_GLOUD
MTISPMKDPHDSLRWLLENNYHGDVHMTLGGTMGTIASSFDPVFYGHHGTVDLLQFIHNRCSYGNKASRRFDVFSRCTVSTDSGLITITPGDKITMTSCLLVRKYFDGLDYTYAQFANAEKIPGNSYRYQVDGYLNTLLKLQGIVSYPVDDVVNKENAPVYEIMNTLVTCGNELMQRKPNMTQ